MTENVAEWDASRERSRLRQENDSMRRELRALYAVLGVMASMTPFPTLAIELAFAAAGVNVCNPSLEPPTAPEGRR